MGFGNGYKHEDSSEMLEEGFYTAKITKAELKNGNYGDYIQAEVEVKDHPNCNPHIFLLSDIPQKGYGSMTLEQAQKMWNRNMTLFFANFSIPEGDFEPTHWVGKVGEITVRQQKKNPQYNEIIPYKVSLKKSSKKEEVSTHTDTNNPDGFKEDVPDIF